MGADRRLLLRAGDRELLVRAVDLHGSGSDGRKPTLPSHRRVGQGRHPDPQGDEQAEAAGRSHLYALKQVRLEFLGKISGEWSKVSMLSRVEFVRAAQITNPRCQSEADLHIKEKALLFL